MREEPLKPLHLFSKKKATSKIAFTKAKKNLKALFGGRKDEEEKDEPSTRQDQSYYSSIYRGSLAKI